MQLTLVIFLSSVTVCSAAVRSAAGNGTHFTVGTVLFTASDMNKDCWSPESAALLTSRMLIRNAMPHVNTLKVDDDKFIVDIIDYFRLMLEVIRSMTFGKTKHIMLLAFTDALGGYMKHLILPIAKYAYYAGNVDYASIIKLYQLYDELKNYLHTNGNGWAKPWKRAGKHIQAKAIMLQTPTPATDPCKGIIYFKHIVGGGDKRRSMEATQRTKTCSMDVPLPFFDSKTHPSAIAVPFKTFGLRNLESRVSAYILVKFYVGVCKCMASRNTVDEDVQKFNANVYTFIMTKVMPHLCDEKFYAAFGGVLRILETIKKIGNKNGKQIGSFNILPEVEEREPNLDIGDEGEENGPANAAAARGKGEGAGSEGKRSKNSLILMAALATIIIWFCLGAAFVCCRVRASKVKKSEEKMRALETTAGGGGGGRPRSYAKMDDVCREDSCPAYEASSISTIPQEYQVAPSIGKTKPSSTKSSTQSSRSTGQESDGKKSEVLMIASSDSLVRPGSSSKPVETSPARSKSPYRVGSVHYYPPAFACHTSITGKVKVDSSTEDYNTSRDEPKRPYVFGYDFQTTSDESSPRDTTDGENEMGGDMSK